MAKKSAAKRKQQTDEAVQLGKDLWLTVLKPAITHGVISPRDWPALPGIMEKAEALFEGDAEEDE